MPKLKGIKKLNGAIEELKAMADEVRSTCEEKQEWFDSRSDRYQESEKGQEWSDYLDALSNTLDNIDNLEIIDEDD